MSSAEDTAAAAPPRKGASAPMADEAPATSALGAVTPLRDVDEDTAGIVDVVNAAILEMAPLWARAYTVGTIIVCVTKSGYRTARYLKKKEVRSFLSSFQYN